MGLLYDGDLDYDYDAFDVLERVAELCEGTGETDVVPVFPTCGGLAKHVDARTVQTPALDIVDEALREAANGECPRLIITMAPQEGKTQRVARTLPLWLLQRNPDLRIGIVSYAEDLAMTSSALIRDDIVNHPELGLVLAPSTRAKGEWKLASHDGGVIARGIGGGLAGRPLDVLVIDDPFKDRVEAASVVYRARAWSWWTQVGSARLGPGSLVVIITTRWHEDDLVGRLVAGDRDDDVTGLHAWKVINIPARAMHDPSNPGCRCAGPNVAEGAPRCLGSDVLGRAFGEYMISARGRSQTEWEVRERTAGPFAWTALYQGHPSPEGGGILKREWFHFYEQPRGIARDDGTWYAVGADEVWLSVDCTFKDTKDSDYVCMQVWGKRGAKAWLLDQIWDRMDFVRTCRELQFLSAKWPQAVGKLIEAKANGVAVINSLAQQLHGMVPYEPTESKEARVHSVAPIIAAGSAEFPHPDIAPWIIPFIDECTSFPNAVHDDRVDTMSQILRHLFLAAGSGDFMAALMAEQGRGGANVAQVGSQSWTPHRP